MKHNARLSSDSETNDNIKLDLFFLIGFMASGKSALGRKAAEKLNISHVEMDDEIIKLAGKSINKIFQEDGEETFRRMERAVLDNIIAVGKKTRKPMIISTGGGAPCYFDNMDLMKKKGRTIFIHPSTTVLAHRLELGKEERPLIRGKTQEEIRQYVTDKMKERMEYYGRADILFNPIYDDKELNVGLLAKIIASLLQP